MSRNPKRGRNRKNKGWFKKGHDARRHVFTTSECRVGYWVVMMGLTPKTQDPAVREWVRRKVCIHNRTKGHGHDAPSDGGNHGENERQEDGRGGECGAAERQPDGCGGGGGDIPF